MSWMERITMANLDSASTIDDHIAYGKELEVSHDRLHLKATFRTNGDKVIINYSSILDKYMDYLQAIIETVKLTDDEYIKYKFQPKRLCYDYYGSVDLWSSILRINNLTSASQFTSQTIKVFTPDVFNVLNEIINIERNSIEENRQVILKG